MKSFGCRESNLSLQFHLLFILRDEGACTIHHTRITSPVLQSLNPTSSIQLDKKCATNQLSPLSVASQMCLKGRVFLPTILEPENPASRRGNGKKILCRLEKLGHQNRTRVSLLPHIYQPQNRCALHDTRGISLVLRSNKPRIYLARSLQNHIKPP
jgi:hypothetical protein